MSENQKVPSGGFSERSKSFTELQGVYRSAEEVIDQSQSREDEKDKDDFLKSIEAHSSKLWALMDTYIATDQLQIQKSIVNHIEYSLACNRFNFTAESCYHATALSVRDRLIESWNDTQSHFLHKDCKRVYYMSMEYLIGRLLQNHLINLDLDIKYKDALMDLGVKLEELTDYELDPGLGNGGLGRLAACFMDSMATLNLPAWGYGLRYKYGMFRQFIKDNQQHEEPDYWLTKGASWEIERLDINFSVRFYGHLEESDGVTKWTGGEVVQAVAHDMPISGFDTYNTINLRLWRAAPCSEFNLSKFNAGDYSEAVKLRQRAETITAVLYPNDNTTEGKELRLKQQYFFSCATLQDIILRFKQRSVKKKELTAEDWSILPSKVAIQLNDTHPTISIVELMRVLIDEEQLEWDEAWPIVTETFAYTNHTILPEALEKWSVALLGHVLPRHLQIMFDINARFLSMVEQVFPDDTDMLRHLSIVDEGYPKSVRMAHLAIVGTHAINGVAAIHSELLKKQVFPHFYKLYPDKFQNKTNGVTPRRWIKQANPELSDCITKWLGSEAWLKDLSQLTGLKQFADDEDLQTEWAEIKHRNKVRLSKYIKKHLKIAVPHNALYDIQVKRIHEYKRQLMNILYCIHRYSEIKRMTPAERANVVHRVTIFGGKAAPGYDMAKRFIRLIHDVADVVNNDRDVCDLFKIVFIPNYNVSAAEVIIPASDISQHISTAGMEASGTSNMKFVMNSGIILGTMDGANIEIAEEIGKENMFIFGAEASEVDGIRHQLRYRAPTPLGPELANVIDMLQGGVFCDFDAVRPILNVLQLSNDYYIVTRDFKSYLKAQQSVDECYKNKQEWVKKSIMNTAGSGKFSTDRTIEQYASEIWNIKPAMRPDPREQGSAPLF